MLVVTEKANLQMRLSGPTANLSQSSGHATLAHLERNVLKPARWCPEGDHLAIGSYNSGHVLSEEGRARAEQLLLSTTCLLLDTRPGE